MRKMLMALTAVIAMGAGVPTAAAHSDHDVEIRDGSFAPERLEIRAGDTVEWRNEGQRPHSVTSDGGSFDSGVIEPGERFERRFVVAGTYPYGSSAQDDEAMDGIVVVLPADEGGSSGSSGGSGSSGSSGSSGGSGSSGSSGEGGSSGSSEAVDGSAPGSEGGGDSAGDGGADAASAGSLEPAGSAAQSRSSSVGSAGSVLAQAAAVAIQDDVFVPRQVEIDAGGTVVWEHAGQRPHSVTASEGSFDSRTLESGASFSQTFSQPGTFTYYCRFHGSPSGQGMAGVVVVRGAPSEVGGEAAATGEQTGGLAATGRSVAAHLGLAVTLLLAGLWLLRRSGSGLSRL
jgi:plastocyanin